MTDDIIQKQLRDMDGHLAIVPCPDGIDLRLKLALDIQHHYALSEAVAQGPHENIVAMWAWAYSGGLAIAGYIGRNADFFAGKTVLDIGTGSGIAALAAAKAGAHVIAVDSSPFAVRMVAANAALNGLQVKAIEADFLQAGELLTPDYRHVDIVTAADVILPYYMEGEDANRRSMAAMFAAGERLQKFVEIDGKTMLYSSHSMSHRHVFQPERVAIQDLDPRRDTNTSFVKVTPLPHRDPA